MADNWRDGEFGLQYFNDVNGQLNINASFDRLDHHKSQTGVKIG